MSGAIGANGIAQWVHDALAGGAVVDEVGGAWTQMSKDGRVVFDAMTLYVPSLMCANEEHGGREMMVQRRIDNALRWLLTGEQLPAPLASTLEVTFDVTLSVGEES